MQGTRNLTLAILIWLQHVSIMAIGHIMLYGTEGGVRGRKSKYTVLPRGGRVQFGFWNGTAGWPSTVLFFKLSCWAAESNWQAGQGRSIRRPDEAAVGGRVRSPDRSAGAGLSIGQGRPTGDFEKQNCTRPPGTTISKVKMYKATLREDRIFWFSDKSPSLSSIWIVDTDEPLMVFLGPIVKVGCFCETKVEKSTVQRNGDQPTA